MSVTTLSVIAKERFGTIKGAAAEIGVHPNTMSRACQGLSVRDDTRRKLERAFGLPIDDLLKPLAATLMGEN
jgi:plasmid maintenance system antidote protein VapI